MAEGFPSSRLFYLFGYRDLRHTFVTDMRRAGVERTQKMTITGRTFQEMNLRYDTIKDWKKIQAITKLRPNAKGFSQKFPKPLLQIPIY